jgi:hypothetical protein
MRVFECLAHESESKDVALSLGFGYTVGDERRAVVDLVRRRDAVRIGTGVPNLNGIVADRVLEYLLEDLWRNGVHSAVWIDVICLFVDDGLFDAVRDARETRSCG